MSEPTNKPKTNTSDYILNIARGFGASPFVESKEDQEVIVHSKGTKKNEEYEKQNLECIERSEALSHSSRIELKKWLAAKQEEIETSWRKDRKGFLLVTIEEARKAIIEYRRLTEIQLEIQAWIPPTAGHQKLKETCLSEIEREITSKCSIWVEKDHGGYSREFVDLKGMEKELKNREEELLMLEQRSLSLEDLNRYRESLINRADFLVKVSDSNRKAAQRDFHQTEGWVNDLLESLGRPERV